jgi:hypothetical protein
MEQTYDITWIMQSYLGDYPGSRSNPEVKFHRAVSSFLAMNDPRTQLVIASDGCMLTHRLYNKHFKKFANIDYVFIDKDPNTTMHASKEEDRAYYRGKPRQAARALAKGVLTTYIDSDDFLRPEAANWIRTNWIAGIKEHEKALKWMRCTNWMEHASIMESWNAISSEMSIPDDVPMQPHGDIFEIKDLPDSWIEFRFKDWKTINQATMGLIHASNCKTKWKDVKSLKSDQLSEDMLFSRGIQSEGPGVVIDAPFYVRCHHNKLGIDV